MLGNLFLVILAVLYGSAIGSASVILNDINEVENHCNTKQCKFLYNNIVRHLNLTVNRCEDIYSFTCGNNNVYNTEKNVNKLYMDILANLKKLLASKPQQLEYKSLGIEKQLYQQCMQLGIEHNQQAEKDVEKKSKILHQLLILAIKNTKWQELDHEMHKSGFGHAFFNIKVVRDPEDSEKNIIMLEPPSLSSLSNVIVLLQTIFENKSSDEYKNLDNQKILFYKTLNADAVKLIINFLSSLLQAAYNIESHYHEKNQNKKTTILEWYHEFNGQVKRNGVTDINWSEIIIETFREVDIEIENSEPLIVKNEAYFSFLFNILHDTPNDIIGTAIITKVVTENLRYIDWNFAQVLNRKDRSSFCLYETKLYAASYKMLREFQNNEHNIFFNEESYELIQNIVRSFRSEIYKASTLTFKEETYLLAELDAIAVDSVVNKWNPYYISEYYTNYTISHSYFSNIINYKKVLNKKELITLRRAEYPTKYLPFSIVDIEKPANRFTLSMYLTNAAFTHKTLPRIVHYANYGVRMASLLYALLNENKLHDVLYLYGFGLSAHPDYSLHKMQCLRLDIKKNDKEEVSNAISDSFGLKVAYNALIELDNSYADDFDYPLFPLENIYDFKQFFYLIYAKSHCEINKFVVNSAVFHSEYFTRYFPDCAKYIYAKCKQTIFQYISKNAYLIKL